MARILIIDDEEPIRGLLRQILEEAGHEVMDASDGASGIALYRQNLIDLLIVDLVMPRKTGIDVIMELRRDFPDANIIAISGGGAEGNFDYLAASKVLGAQRSFLKPFSRRKLLAAIKELVPV
jgi:two-component system response regulator (stage 0 sporulation protein F)